MKHLPLICSLAFSVGAWAQSPSQSPSQNAPQLAYSEEAIVNLSGRLRLLNLEDNYYSSKAQGWLDAVRLELALQALQSPNAKLVNDMAYNAERIITSLEDKENGFKQIAVATKPVEHPTISKAQELQKLYEFKNCMTPMRGAFEVLSIYTQTRPVYDVAYTALGELNKKVINDQRTNCAEFKPILPSDTAITTQIRPRQPLVMDRSPAKPLATVLADRVPDDINVYLNGEIKADMPLVVDAQKDWFDAINAALIPQGFEMKYDVSKKSVHLGPFVRSKRNDVPPTAFSVNSLLAHWAGKAGLTITTDGALVDYSLTEKAKAEDYADDLRIAVQQLLNFYKEANIPIVVDVRNTALHITNQPKVATR